MPSTSTGPKSILPRTPSPKLVEVTVARGTIQTHEGIFGPGEKCTVHESDLPRLYAARIVRDPRTIEKPGDAEKADAARLQFDGGPQVHQIGRVDPSQLDPTGS
jgi:hypothetical protein